jgi:thioredoxin 1
MDELEEIRKKKMRELMEATRKKEEAKDYPDRPITITDSNFHETIRRYPLIVVDCWAAWCAPCRMIAPVIDELAREYAGKAVFGKLNTDENRVTSMHYNIMSIPTLLIMKQGVEVDRIIGAVPKKVIEGKLQKHLLRGSSCSLALYYCLHLQLRVS